MSSTKKTKPKAIKKMIPAELKIQIDEAVQNFNKKFIKKGNRHYVTQYKGNFLCLNTNDGGKVFPVCRLKYNGAIDDWDFAIFKYSKDRYDPDEWMFPGSEHIDGTIEGAMQAGLEAYP